MPIKQILRCAIALLFCICLSNTAIAAAPSFPGGLIVNHTSVSSFDYIPSVWIDEAKNITLHYAHTSHGSQIISGIIAWESVSPIYSVAVRESSTEGLPAAEDPAALRIYDGNPPNTYITPDLYWDGTSAMDMTRDVADTAHYNYSMWSWCGQQSSNDTTAVARYLDNLNTLESEYPAMRFIYMTGHTDGTDTPGTPGTQKYNNNLVRQYARDHDKILFDFADIESYDPDGNFYVNNGDGDCTWCAQWCADHPTDCQNLTDSCAHTHPYNCKLKAKAFWYMMSRLAGWDGSSACNTLPARNSTTSSGYADIQTAYAAADINQTVMLQNFVFSRDITFDIDKDVNLSGGYDCEYSTNSGFTTLTGSLTIRGGSITVGNLIIK